MTAPTAATASAESNAGTTINSSLRENVDFYKAPKVITRDNKPQNIALTTIANRPLFARVHAIHFGADESGVQALRWQKDALKSRCVFAFSLIISRS